MLPIIVKAMTAVMGIQLPQPKKAQEGPIHTGVKCGFCGLKDIQGTRYKCTECSEYDLCEECERIQIHPHCLVKISSPQQAPALLLHEQTHPLLRCLAQIEKSQSRGKRR